MEKRSESGRSSVVTGGSSTSSAVEEHTLKDKIKTMFGLSSRPSDAGKSMAVAADPVGQRRSCPALNLSLDLLKGVCVCVCVYG